MGHNEIRNATTCIWGILARVKKKGFMIKKDFKEIRFQLERIESHSDYVRKMNKGD